jgi:hypothetical protein
MREHQDIFNAKFSVFPCFEPGPELLVGPVMCGEDNYSCGAQNSY